MEIAYERKLKNSYMILKAKQHPETYDGKVLKSQKCEGLLPVEVLEQDGETEYWFEVSGKQSLDVYMSVHSLDEEFFKRFLCALNQTVEWIEVHLLEEQHLMLMPETIFINMDTKICSFCYCMDFKEELAGQFQKLMEELLKKLDHREEGAVRLAYKLYDISLKEGYRFLELKDATDEAAKDSRQKETERYEALSDVECEDEREQKYFLEEKPEPAQGKKILKRVRIQKIWEQVSHWRKAWSNSLWMKEKKKEDVPLYFEPEEEMGESHPTVLLAKREDGVQGILLYEGSGEQEDLRIKELPFLIGSDETRVQGIIRNEAVSRIHAKITKEEEVYFLEDLNSTNGTFVEQEILNYKVKISLRQNSRVRFANENYRFI